MLNTLSPYEVYEGDCVTLDFETDTSHGDYGHPVHPDNGLVLACWRTPDGELHQHFGSEFEQQRLLEDIRNADFIVAHNAKYELGWLMRCGLSMYGLRVFDTKIAEYVIWGNRCAKDEKTGLAPVSTSLDACCRRRGWRGKDPVINHMMSGGVNPIDQPRPWLLQRCLRDVRDTYELFRNQYEYMKIATPHKYGQVGVLQTRCLVTPVLAEMELTGMYLDAERVEQVYDEHAKRLAELEREFDILANGVNFRSPKQVANLLYSSEDEGVSVLTNHVDATVPHVALRLEIGELTKKQFRSLCQRLKGKELLLVCDLKSGKVGAALSKSLEYFHGVCAEHEGLLYAAFNQTRTATHRLLYLVI